MGPDQDTNLAPGGPSYRGLFQSGELSRRAERARGMMVNCRLCPRNCRARRLDGQLGFCQAGSTARVYKYKVHHGEEPPISGQRGSGIVFFAHCTLRCAYCQNVPMSHWGRGFLAAPKRLAQIFLALQQSGCHNLNLVTATHFLPDILEALCLASGQGLCLPIVYNTSGYETLEVLGLLDGVVDIYLPDMKYAHGEPAGRYSSAPDYPLISLLAVQEMFRQVGLLRLDEEGIARRGLIIRHLILPHGLAGTKEVLKTISARISPHVHISLMSQYLPLWSARQDPLLGRRLTQEEYDLAMKALEESGLSQGWVQELESRENIEPENN
jgi:putative pyruvate formate lyase activating enzyme